MKTGWRRKKIGLPPKKILATSLVAPTQPLKRSHIKQCLQSKLCHMRNTFLIAESLNKLLAEGRPACYGYNRP